GGCREQRLYQCPLSITEVCGLRPSRHLRASHPAPSTARIVNFRRPTKLDAGFNRRGTKGWPPPPAIAAARSARGLLNATDPAYMGPIRSRSRGSSLVWSIG